MTQTHDAGDTPAGGYEPPQFDLLKHCLEVQGWTGSMAGCM